MYQPPKCPYSYFCKRWSLILRRFFPVNILNEFYIVFEVGKFGLFQKHSFTLKDIQRPLHDIILEAIENYGKFL